MVHRRISVVVRLVVALCALPTVGCASHSEWVTVRDTPRNPLAGTLDLVSPGGPKPTERTRQLLRRYDLSGDFKGDRAALLSRLEDIQRREPNREHEYAMAELAYITAKQAEQLKRQKALEFYGTALIHAYRYLFEFENDRGRGRPGSPAINPYDPQFRGASDLYNQSLEGMLRLVRQEGELRPGTSRTVKTANHTCSFDVVMHSTGWRPDDIDRLEFVSDYKVQGLRNHYHTYGLGVPLIAVRRSHAAGQDPAEHFYPPDVCFPITAFLRVDRPARLAGRVELREAAAPMTTDPTAPHFVLELHDPLDRQSIDVAGRGVPLEADLSTPLAYFLNQPEFQDADLSTKGLLHPSEARNLQGLYMLEPFDPDKMPVVMVHGLWSSPITWMEMYNDLRSDPLVRQHYQFWFYLYPTGQPFWISATQMREDLALMRRELDPKREDPALDQMVLVGHSMGGLVSKLQTVESEEAFWETMSDHPFSELYADPDVVRSLASTFYFRPNPSVRRVVTLGTPHRGSPFANGITRWLGGKLITLPTKMLEGRDQLVAQNRRFFRPNAPLDIKTSIDSLAPDSPMLPALLAAAPGPWVRYHNVVGHDPDPGWERYLVPEGDGVVSLTSARLDELRQLRSQITVPADHSSVHRHPQSVLEVRRLLFEQLAELQQFPYGTQVAGQSESPL
ncbi:MAG: alpha/beta fold hydrolase [Planctomycetes bacterium]|nr:alpha/beta fold hydrolase [Planctomycetota bacterium]